MTTPNTIPIPPPLSVDQRERLTRYEDTPDEAKSLEELLDELRLRGLRAERDKYREAALIRRMLPPEEAPRGVFTKVAEASRYTREYVSRIRHWKVPTMNYTPRAGA